MAWRSEFLGVMDRLLTRAARLGRLRVCGNR